MPTTGSIRTSTEASDFLRRGRFGLSLTSHCIRHTQVLRHYWSHLAMNATGVVVRRGRPYMRLSPIGIISKDETPVQRDGIGQYVVRLTARPDDPWKRVLRRIVAVESR